MCTDIYITIPFAASIHVDPLDASGEEHHRIAEHRHGDWLAHSQS